MNKLNKVVDIKSKQVGKDNLENTKNFDNPIPSEGEIVPEGVGLSEATPINSSGKATPYDKVTNKEIEDKVDQTNTKNDSILERDYLSSLVEQEDRLVYYEVENIYSNQKTKSYRNKLSLKKDPPVLVIKDNQENEASFLLTENITNELLGTLKEVERAYYGFSGPKELNQPSGFKNRLFFYFKSQPLKLLLPVLITAFTLFFILTK